MNILSIGRPFFGRIYLPFRNLKEYFYQRAYHRAYSQGWEYLRKGSLTGPDEFFNRLDLLSSLKGNSARCQAMRDVATAWGAK